MTEVEMNVGPNFKVKLDRESAVLAAYLSWANRVCALATRLPLISYRGHGDASWKLLPSLCREEWPVRLLMQRESEVIEEFRNRFPLKDRSDFEVLAYARHHGAPTRLLDWSKNPLIGLWFAVYDKAFDNTDGSVFQLFAVDHHAICLGINFQLDHAEKCEAKKSIHVLPSPPRITRSDRQESVFTITTFNGDAVLKPLDTLVTPLDKGQLLHRFPVPANHKASMRRLLLGLGLDAYSVYGDPDSFGRSLTALYDLSDLSISKELPAKE